MSHSLSQPKSGIHYFLRGWQLITLPGLRAFVIIPLVANLLLFSGMIILLFSQLGHWLTAMVEMLPSWLSWLEWLLWPAAVITILLASSFSFAMVGNFIAAPFNGFLSEKVELYLTGQPLESTTLSDLIKDIPRILAREWIKVFYWLPRAIGLLILFLVPVIGQAIAPVLWFLFAAWMLAIQYNDYPFDNHRVPFPIMRQALHQQRKLHLTFGALVSIATSLPLINIIIMPVAVCGATALWVDQYRDQLRQSEAPPEAAKPRS